MGRNGNTKSSGFFASEILIEEDCSVLVKFRAINREFWVRVVPIWMRLLSIYLTSFACFQFLNNQLITCVF